MRVPSSPRLAGRREGCDDRLLLLADAERLEGRDHAGGMRPRIPHDPGQYRQGRPVQAGVPRDQPEQPDAGDRRPRRTRAGRSACSNPARSCCYLAEQDRPVPARRTAPAARRSWSGCSGRSAIWGRWPGSSAISSTTRRKASTPIRSQRYANEYDRCLGVLERRLEGREYIVGRVLDRRHVLLAMGADRQAARPVARRLPARRAPGGQRSRSARRCSAASTSARSAAARRRRARPSARCCSSRPPARRSAPHETACVNPVWWLRRDDVLDRRGVDRARRATGRGARRGRGCEWRGDGRQPRARARR